MNNKQEVERMAEVFFATKCKPAEDCEKCKYCGYDCCADWLAFDAMVNAGIGDKKQAVKEFIKKIREHITDKPNICYTVSVWEINQLFTELYGEESN